MATTGVDFILSEESKNLAIKYIEESGFYKGRLADFLGISRPTLNKLLEEYSDLFTAFKRADAVFCKKLIDKVAERNPIFILRTRYKDEFNERGLTSYDPEEEIQRMARMMDACSDDEDNLPENTQSVTT